eukprot:CAMPEP_0197633126 /NCGR_PEP_ID=MMETSP1338-20131121/9551_1 /TAXON_ID=43686 ORGANISM="Pelagodinium beii, Strain RCC1491" /NCGR_SAMPLE_ID=MMETSP1338 /ASSEMBLY_ACC=CAM_ASM_000754 /LENGTH=627 /DNA_ID=CAMNT_0043204719 /DNA_START=83 /DNA_END=1963 /DNA_ORIENTATION=-
MATSFADDIETQEGSEADASTSENSLGMTATQSITPAVARRASNRRQRKSARQVFVDADAMKAKIRAAAVKKKYDVSMYYWETGLARTVATNHIFDQFTLGVIAFNAFWIMIDTDLNPASTLLTAHPVFVIAENLFCAYFFFEWTVRFFAFKWKPDGLRDFWFVFDSCLVFSMVGETWILTIILVASGETGESAGGGGGIFRLARLMRLSRMARMIRLLRAFPELLIMIKGMAAAMRSVMFTLILLFVFIYVFGIGFRQLTADTAVGAMYFNGVFRSMHTLLLDGTLMDNLGGVVEMLGKEGDGIVFVFIWYLFVLMSALTVMNMLIGVLCEIVSAVSASERETIAVAAVRDRLMHIMNDCGIDQDGDGTISKEEFSTMLQVPEATRALSECGVDIYSLIDNMDFIFESANPTATTADGEKSLSFLDFLDLILALRGSNLATVKDIVDLRKQVKVSFDNLKENLQDWAVDFLKPKRSSNASSDTKRSSDTATLAKVQKLSGDHRRQISEPEPQEVLSPVPPSEQPRPLAPDEQSIQEGYWSLLKTLALAQTEVEQFLKDAPQVKDNLASEQSFVAGSLPGQVGSLGFQGSLLSGHEAWLHESLTAAKSDLAELQKSLDEGLVVLEEP